MSWSQKQKDFGVLKIDGRKVKVYSTPSDYAPINLNDDISDARWAGDAIVITFKNGKVRRYTSPSEYKQI